MKKLVIWIVIIAILIGGGVWGMIEYNKYYKTTPAYLLRMIGMGIITRGEEKYISAVEELVDADKVLNAMESNVNLSCLNVSSNESFREIAKRYDAKKDKVRKVFEIIRDQSSMTADFDKTKLPKLLKIKQIKRRRNGELKEYALAPLKFPSGLILEIRLEKEDNVWVPTYLENCKETVCNWIDLAEKGAKKNKTDIDTELTIITYVATINDPDLNEYIKEVK